MFSAEEITAVRAVLDQIADDITDIARNDDDLVQLFLLPSPEDTDCLLDLVVQIQEHGDFDEGREANSAWHLPLKSWEGFTSFDPTGDGRDVERMQAAVWNELVVPWLQAHNTPAGPDNQTEGAEFDRATWRA